METRNTEIETDLDLQDAEAALAVTETAETAVVATEAAETEVVEEAAVDEKRKRKSPKNNSTLKWTPT